MMIPGIASAVEKFGPALMSAKDKIGKGDTATLWVRLARAGYVGSATVIVVAWYAGWRNERTEPGELAFPFPGLTKRKATGSVDRPDLEPLDAQQLLATVGQSSGAAIANAGIQAGSPTAAAIGLGIQGIGDLTGRAGIIKVGKLAQKLGLRVGENPSFGGVSPVHANGSLHYSGRAIDVNGVGASPTKEEDAFANMLISTFGPSHFTELIWNGPHPVSVKNGQVVPPSFWGTQTWNGHRDHVHVAI